MKNWATNAPVFSCVCVKYRTKKIMYICLRIQKLNATRNPRKILQIYLTGIAQKSIEVSGFNKLHSLYKQLI